MRLVIEGDADARLMCGDACAEWAPFAATEVRGGAESMVEPRIGS